MNYKQKLGYMALGALILAMGITIGQLVSPPTEAQNNGVFDEITCRSLRVVDKDGEPAISLEANEIGNAVSVYDPAEKRAVWLVASQDHNAVYFSGQTKWSK